MGYAVPKMPKTPDIKLGADGQYSLDGGINLQYQETALSMNQSPYLLNLNADDRGTLIKRMGQAYLDTSLGAGQVNGVCIYKGKIIKAWNTYLYSENLDGSNQVQIYSGLADSKAFFFIFTDGLLYMLNGANYIQYDGITVQNVVPYVPEITQGRKPDGTTSTLREPLNLITGQFIDSFSSDGTTTYKLSFTGLDSIDEVKVNGSVVSSGITLNPSSGTVVFSSPPATATANNVKIKATKTNPSDKLQILNCTIAKAFSSRIFLTGNPNYPNRLWKSGLAADFTTAANYFPASGYSSFDAVSGVDQSMVNFVQQYTKLIYLKEKSTFITEAMTMSDGSTGFPINPLNAAIGCDMPGSVQLINNNPVWANTYGGVYMMISTTVLGEKNIIPISANINGIQERPGLLQEQLTDLKNCSSWDDGKKYYLCVGNKVYVWDYSLGYDLNNPSTLHWFIYDNVNALQFFSINNNLCYADRSIGALVKFIDARNDFGQPINAYWRSKLMDFGFAEWYKNITDLWVTTRADSDSTLLINYYDDNGEILTSSTIPNTETKAFDWDNVDLDLFIYDGQKFAPTIRFRPGVKGIRYFQLELINKNYNEQLSIISIVIKYALTRLVR